MAWLFGPAVVDRVIETSFHMDDYFVLNIGRWKFEDEDKDMPVTIGIMNNVFLLASPKNLKKDNKSE